MADPLFSIARFTLVEARHARIGLLTVLNILVWLLLANLLSALAITDSQHIFIGTFATGMRLGSVVLIALFVATGSVRELSDGGCHFLLSRPLSRTRYYCGKLLACLIIAMLIAMLTIAALWPFAGLRAATFYGVGMGCELIVVAGFALAATTAIGQAPAAVLASAAFYLLTRSIGAIVLMSESALALDQGSIGAQLARVLAWLLPDLAEFSSTSTLWLHDAQWSTLGVVGLQTIVYLAVLSGIGLFDLQRKSL